MTRAIRTSMCAAALLCAAASAWGQTAAAPNTLSAADKKDGWVLLFNGTTLEGWRGYKRPDTKGTRWVVQDGLLTLSSGDSADTKGQRDIIAPAPSDQFELSWEWRIAEGGNSGVKYFVLEDRDSAIGHEYQLIDDARHADAKVGPQRQTGALYDVLPASANRPVKPAGEWNQSRVVVKGLTVEHYLNGTKVLQYELSSAPLAKAVAGSKFKDVPRFGKPQKGFVLLQDHGDAVWFRNLKIRPTNGQS